MVCRNEFSRYDREFSAPYLFVVEWRVAQSPMPYKKIFWGILFVALTLISPLPAIAQSPTLRQTNAPLQTGNLSQPNSKIETYAFSEVWPLILKYQRAYGSHFSPELIACLIWEESGFRLIENPKSGAMGFGQILPATLRGINARYRTNLTRTALLTSPDASVQATVLTLEIAWNWKKEKTNALLGYAGGMRNYNSVRKWVTGEQQLLRANIANASVEDFSNAQIQNQLAAAMRICSQPGFDPRVLFL